MFRTGITNAKEISDQSGLLFPWPKLVDHSLDIRGGRSGSSPTEQLKGIEIFGLEGFFSGFYNHSAFNPHLHLVLDGQVGTFGDEQ